MGTSSATTSEPGRSCADGVVLSRCFLGHGLDHRIDRSVELLVTPFRKGEMTLHNHSRLDPHALESHAVNPRVLDRHIEDAAVGEDEGTAAKDRARRPCPDEGSDLVRAAGMGDEL